MTTPAAVLLELDALRVVLLVLLGRIVTTLALGASKGNQSTHCKSSYLRTQVRRLSPSDCAVCASVISE